MSIGNNPFAAAARSSTGGSAEPAPNSEPIGALAGVPPRTKFYQRGITSARQQIVEGTAENRIVTVIAPLTGWGIWIGDQSVSPKSGFLLPAGQPFPFPLTGLQDAWAVTDAPITIPLPIMVAMILFAERQRIVGR